MPKFLLDLLPVINTNNDYQIELDNIPYNENESYTKVNQIFFSNKYGSFKLKGFFDLSNKNINSLIAINKLSLLISDQLLDACIYNFCKYRMEIELNFTYDNIKPLKNYEQELINKYNCKIDYNNRKIYIALNELKNIDIMRIIQKDLNEEEKGDLNYLNIFQTRQKIKNIDEDQINLSKFSKVKVNYDNNENVQNENIEEFDETSNIEEMSKLDNPFIDKLSDKTEDKKMDNISEIDVNMGFGNKNNFIKFNNINTNVVNNLIFSNESEKFLNKINPKFKNYVGKLIENGAALMKKNIKTNVLNSININGCYFLLNKNNDKYGNNYKFTLNKLLLNDGINNLSDYKKVIFGNYINILENVVKQKRYNNLDLNDFTYIIMSYISQVQNKVDEIEKNQNKNIDDNIYTARYKKIILMLKLFFYI